LDYLAERADNAEIANAAMISLTSVDLSEILAAYDFSRLRTNRGCRWRPWRVATRNLAASHRLRGVLADQP
jgi:hypothetical protein